MPGGMNRNKPGGDNCHVKLQHEWRNWLHVRGLGKGWWELAGWAVAQRKPQRTDQALERFHAYLPDMPAWLQNPCPDWVAACT